MKTKHLFIYLISTMMAMSSCKDFLDLEPKSAATDENFWKTQDDAEAAVAGTYALLRAAFNFAGGISFYAYGDLPSDEFSASNTFPFSQVLNIQWNLFVAPSDVDNAMYRLRNYSRFYRVIDQTNRVIEFVQTMDPALFDSPARRDYILGEAYFMRAFTYFYMGRVWGGVPIITEAVPPIYAENHAAATPEEVLAQSSSDLETAKRLLDWRNPVSSQFGVRANKGAAFALEAHMQAWVGNYQEAASAADSLIQSGLYYYVSRDSIVYRNIYQGGSAEGIFEISHNAANEGTRVGIGDYTLVYPYHRLITVPRLTIPPARIRSLFTEPEDKRLKFAFDTTINSTYVICHKYANLTYSDETNNAIPIFKNNIVVFRFSDIKLLRAEALAAIGQTADAEAILNEVRLQANLPAWSGQGSLIKAIFDERARELFLEGHRYYDMIRLYKHFGIFEFPQAKMTPAHFNQGKYYWPFDPTLLNQNPLLRQTPYWATVNL
ncbi:RagB/SusD family nutrient uptake outer membrane protein [Parapedobacter sp. ISTM3]|uniref:RagB/SusD family nutrient uptake outer membrane protein n=1 Tax=Parapedobacter sp. ISTM3 TaxID=2800130 RepID=UPI001902F7F9|nr:RagB/SusD family nutrient uptake outer membrane protein [Parapedobacter sp. ISTM3]MBK1438696.1 RagB/SusD family nutrient uptake outer membrane protein [Parapedobacter sp. ISTM3]